MPPWSMLGLSLPGRRPAAQQESTGSSGAFCGTSLYFGLDTYRKMWGSRGIGSGTTRVIWISPCFRSFYLMARFFVTSAAGLQLSKLPQGKRPWSRCARRSLGVTQDSTLWRDPRRLLDEAFVGLCAKRGRLLPTRSVHRLERTRSLRASAPDLDDPGFSAKCARLERPRSLRASGPDVVPERAAALSPRTRGKVSVPDVVIGRSTSIGPVHPCGYRCLPQSMASRGGTPGGRQRHIEDATRPNGPES